MASLPLGLTAAVGASALYNVGVALQAMEARGTPPEEGLRPSLLARLLRRPRWVLGLGLGIVGWPLQAAALLLAPLTVVQPALGVGLILLLPIGARVLHERIRLRDVGGVLAVLGGVGVLAAAAPAGEGAHAGAGRTALALSALAAIALVPYMRAAAHPAAGRVAALAAGAGFAWSGISTKLFADALSSHRWAGAAGWALATGLASGVALLSESSALQRRPVTEVAPTVFGAQVLIPVAMAPLLVGEAWPGTAASTGGLVVGLAAVLTGVTLLTRSRTIAGLVAPA